MGLNPTRGTFFLRKSDCLGCAVLLCFVPCLLLSFFLLHLSLTCICTYTLTYIYKCTHTRTRAHTHNSHYFVYVVKSNEVPDTSTIQGSGSPSAYITAAYVDVDRRFQASIVIGDNAVTSYNGIGYTNVAVDRGTTYFFFIRLYSSVVSKLHTCVHTCIYMYMYVYPNCAAVVRGRIRDTQT